MWKKQSRSVLEQLETANKAQDDIILKIQTRKNYEIEGCKSIDFTATTHLEYTDDIFIRDLSTDEQTELGINMFHIKIHKTTSSPIHVHTNQSQLIYVKKGSIYDRVSKIRFEKGESLFVSKKNSHSLKYLKNSELIMTFMPGLPEVTD